MELDDLVRALLSGETLVARQWVADAARARYDWSAVPAPSTADPTYRAVAAGIVELLAARNGQEPAAWTAAVPAAPETVYLVRAARTMPRLRRACEQEGPEPLRRRGVLAPADFLTAA